MNNRFLGVVAFAVVVALGASVVVYQLIARRFAGNAAASNRTALMATRDLAIGYVVKEGDFETAKWGGPLPPGAIAKAENAVGRGAIIPTQRGEVLIESHFAAKGAGAGLAVTIPPGKRAVAVKVNEVVGLAGFVLPGMKVDVIACGQPPDKAKDALGSQARTLLQNVEVLSAGQNIQRDTDGKPATVQVVNLLVTPEEAEIMSLAGNETKIQLVLRNPLDQELVKTPGTSEAYLYSGKPAGLPASAPASTRTAMKRPAAPKMAMVVVPVTMEIISGGKRENVKVGQKEEEREVSEVKR